MKKKNPNSNDNTNIVITEDKKEDKSKDFLPTAVSTGDFAMQNVALQMGLNLVSPVDGKYIKQVKSHMLRCHACFNLCPVPRTNDVDEIMRRRQQGNVISTDGESKNYANASLSSSVMGRGFNFCPKCGAGGTLRRCTVRVDGKDGHIHVYLKRNMQWSTRGNVFPTPATQSKRHDGPLVRRILITLATARVANPSDSFSVKIRLSTSVLSSTTTSSRSTMNECLRTGLVEVLVEVMLGLAMFQCLCLPPRCSKTHWYQDSTWRQGFWKRKR